MLYGTRAWRLYTILVCSQLVLIPLVQAEDGEGLYTAKGELELYTGITFPTAASDFYCHVVPSDKLTIIARFDIPCAEMLALAKRSPKIPMPDDNSLNSDFMLSSAIKPYQDQAWFANVLESDYLLSGRRHGWEQDKAWVSRIFASFIDDQNLRIYLIYTTITNIRHAKEMHFYTGINFPDAAENYLLLKKRVGLYQKTLNVSARFDLPKQDGLEFIESIRHRFQFRDDNYRLTAEQQLKDLQRMSGKFSVGVNIVKLPPKVLIGKATPSLRFSVSMATVVFKDDILRFSFDFYERIGLRNKIEELGKFLGVRLSSNVKNIQYHLLWYGGGAMIRFDVPQAEWREILSQLKRDTTLHTLEQGDQLEDRIAANHGIAWWCPERMRDLTWCIKNNGRLFIAGGTVNDRDDVTVFVKFYDVGF